MKFDTVQELEQSLSECSSAFDIERDGAGNLLSFSFKRVYDNDPHKYKIIKNSLRQKDKKNGKKIYIPEKEFYELLADNAEAAEKIKVSSGKIYQYTLNGQTYITEKPDGVRLWDLLDFKKYIRVTWSRFWGHDNILRAGYFGGLIGSNTKNIEYYKFHREKFDVYDIDINHAYPFNYNYPLPTGQFYNKNEWEKLEKKPSAYMNFYHIKLKSIKNSFDVHIPIAPYWEYKDYDFLIGKNVSEMIVTEYRLYLIQLVYGFEAYRIIDTYYCATKIYLSLLDFQERELKLVDEMKEQGGECTNDRKIAINSITGMFARKDQKREITGIKKYMNDIAGEVLELEYTPTEWQKKANYLPLAMAVNDITALRLFFMLNDPNILPLSWNTDGGIIACLPAISPNNTKEMGDVKSKIIYDPEFYNVSFLHGRPLVLDRTNNNIYNTNVVFFDGDKFIAEIENSFNTREGFKKFINYFPLRSELWRGFNSRRYEILIKLNKNDNYIRAQKKSKIFNINDEVNKLLNPFDENINIIRHTNKTFITEKYKKFLKKWY